MFLTIEIYLLRRRNGNTVLNFDVIIIITQIYMYNSYITTNFQNDNYLVPKKQFEDLSIFSKPHA